MISGGSFVCYIGISGWIWRMFRHKKHMANDKGTQPPSREASRKRSDIGERIREKGHGYDG